MSRKKQDLLGSIRNFKWGELQNDNVFVGGEIRKMKDYTGMDTRSGLENLLIVQNKVVNVVSEDYGQVWNEQFFGTIEQRLDDAGIQYSKRSINRENKRFAVDYILEDESLHINIKKGKDKIKPLIRACNSYDGSGLTSGHMGAFREICSNGNHVADFSINFGIRKRGNVMEVIVPKLEELVAAFMDNEWYSLHRKFEVLAESPITNVEDFVKYTLGKTGLLKYEKSEKNPDEISLGAQFIIETIKAEAEELKTKPNLWIGYNAFNAYIHNANEKIFMQQERADKNIFNAIAEMAN